MPALTYYWRIAPFHVAPISLFLHAAILHAVMDAFFKPVANSLGAASQRIERNAQTLGERRPAVDFLPLLVAVILQDQLPAFDRQFFQAPLETFPSVVLLFRFGRDQGGGRQFFKVRSSALRAFQLFEQDQAGHAVTIRGYVADGFALINFADDAVDRLVGAFFGELRPAPVEEFHQRQAQAFILFAGAIGVRVEADQKSGQSLRAQCPFRFGD